MMNPPNFFTKTYLVDNDLSITTILMLLQDVATSHADFLEADRATLLKKGLFWVIARNQIKFHHFTKCNHDVTVTTWPRPGSRFYFDRHYQVIDKTTNDVICNARSRWVLLDTEKREIASRERFTYPLETYYDVNHFNRDFPRIKQGETKCGEYIVKAEDIDENMHFNNAKYGNVIQSFLTLSPHEVIDEVTINYSHEALVGEKIEIFRSINEEIYYISGQIDGKIIFSSEVRVRR